MHNSSDPKKNAHNNKNAFVGQFTTRGKPKTNFRWGKILGVRKMISELFYCSIEEKLTSTKTQLNKSILEDGYGDFGEKITSTNLKNMNLLFPQILRTFMALQEPK